MSQTRVNDLFTETFDEIHNRETDLAIDTDIIKVFTQKGINNISGNIKINFKSSTKVDPNYFKLFYDQSERMSNELGDNAFLYILQLIKSKDFFVKPAVASASNGTAANTTGSANGASYINILPYDYYTNAQTQGEGAWNLLYGRNMSKAKAESIAAHLINNLNKLITYVIQNNLQTPDETFRTYVRDMFAKYDEALKKYKVYDFAHYTLLLPALIQYLCTKKCCDSVDKAIGYVKKNSYLFPCSNNYSSTNKHIMSNQAKTYKLTDAWTANEVHKTKAGQQLMQCSRYNYPFKRTSHVPAYSIDVNTNDKTNLNGVNIVYDQTQDKAPKYVAPTGTLKYIGNGAKTTTDGTFFMKLFQNDVNNVPVYNSGGTQIGTTNYRFNDYFELAGYMHAPYQFSNGNAYAQSGAGNGAQPTISGIISYWSQRGQWKNAVNREKDNCGAWHNRWVHELTVNLYQKVNTNSQWYVLQNNDITNQGKAFYQPRYYTYKSSFWCKTWSDQEPQYVGKQLSNMIINDSLYNTLHSSYYPNYKSNTDGCLTSRITDNNKNIRVYSYQDINNRNISRSSLQSLWYSKPYGIKGIPVYRLKKNFTTLMSFNGAKVFQTGEWADYSKWSNKYFVKFSDTNCQMLLNMSVKSCYAGKLSGSVYTYTGSDYQNNMFNNLNNVYILPGTDSALLNNKTQTELNGKFCYGIKTKTQSYTYTATVPDKMEAFNASSQLTSMEHFTVDGSDMSTDAIATAATTQLNKAKGGIMSLFNHCQKLDKEPYIARIVASPKDTTVTTKQTNAITLYQLLTDVYYFDENTWEYWLNELMKVKSLQQLLNDLRACIKCVPAIIIATRIQQQMKPFVEKYKQSRSFIDLPIGPPMITIPNYKAVFPVNKYSASINYKPLVDGENVTYDPKANSNVIANELDMAASSDNRSQYTNAIKDASKGTASINNTYVKGNFLDDVIQEQLKLCAHDGALNNINDVFEICIPQNGSDITEVTQYTCNIVNGDITKRDTQSNASFGIASGTVRRPAILMTRKPIDDKLLSAYTLITTLHVPTLDIEYATSTGAYTVNFSSLSSDVTTSITTEDDKGNLTSVDKTITSDNAIYIYVTKASACNGNYSVDSLTGTNNTDGCLVTYFTINYNGEELPTVPLVLKQRYAA